MANDMRFSLVKRYLETDPLSSDLLFSLMVAGLTSYRYDTVLKPFPPMYLKSPTAGARHAELNEQENRDYSSLRRDVAQCSKLRSLDYNCAANSRLLELLLWTISGKQFSLKTCNINKFYEIRSLVGHTIDVAVPNYIFEVGYCQSADDKFNSLRCNRSLIYAYHGSRLENFHSILHYGLQGHLNKNSVFGEGTYLSSELSVSIQYSPMSFGWENSILGSQMSCVAVCEIIDDPSVKCKLHESQESRQGTSLNSQNSRARIAGSIGGDVPEKYYVVRNNDVMRVKYLLVYVQKNSRHRETLRCLQKYKFVIILTIYIVFLILLGLFRSVTIRSFLRRFLEA